MNKPRAYFPKLKKADLAEFWRLIEKRGPEECWPWQGYLNYGYGMWYFAGESWKPHRIVWMLEHGAIPEDLTIDHVWAKGCRLKSCCNPAHLEPVTLAENFKRYHRSKKLLPGYDPTKCRHGHDREPGKVCRTCRVLAVAKSQAKRPDYYRAMKTRQRREQRERQRESLRQWMRH